MVIEQNYVLPFEKGFNLFLAFAVSLTFAFNQVYIELACEVRREVAID